mgnify:CR=1
MLVKIVVATTMSQKPNVQLRRNNVGLQHSRIRCLQVKRIGLLAILYTRSFHQGRAAVEISGVEILTP